MKQKKKDLQEKSIDKISKETEQLTTDLMKTIGGKMASEDYCDGSNCRGCYYEIAHTA